MGKKKKINKSNTTKSANTVNTACANNRLILSTLILILYVTVPVFFPNLKTFDSNGPKFLALAVLNILSFGLIIFSKHIRNNNKIIVSVFNNKAGFVYLLFLIFALLSFTKAINIGESILHFVKIFSVFVAVWTIALAIIIDKRSLKYLSLFIVSLLIVESVQVYYEVYKYKLGAITTNDIKIIYSNKNILSAALFLKIPFAIYLFLFHKRSYRLFGIIGFASALMAILFLGTRAFYLGFILLVVCLFITIIFYSKSVKKVILFTGLSLLLVVSLILIQKVVYSGKKYNFYTASSRFSSIFKNNHLSTDNKRIESWENSLKLIKSEPILGVGVGNWKIRELEYENKTSIEFKYLYKAHNDFIEITAEMGIFAGLLFIMFFVLVSIYFIKSFINVKFKAQKDLFLIAFFGLLGYFFDAFFNFPQDRPEIQVYFALMIGFTIAALSLIYSEENGKNDSFFIKNKNVIVNSTLITTFALMVFSVFILKMNFNSLRLQRIIKDEFNSGALRTSSDMLIKKFPPIPSINIVAEPIAVQIARYLIKENQFDKAIKILKNDNSNPFDSRREFFLSQIYYNQKQYDSAFYYAKKAQAIKPAFFNINAIIASIYEYKKQPDSAIYTWENFLMLNKTRIEPYKYLSIYYEIKNENKKALNILNEGLEIFKNNYDLEVRKSKINDKVLLGNDLDKYNSALKLSQQGKYNEAVAVFNSLLLKNDSLISVYENLSYCYYYLKKYDECISATGKILVKFPKIGLNGILWNLRGVCSLELSKRDIACACFKSSMNKGSNDGKANYEKFCKSD